MRKVFTVEEAATLLKLHPETIRRYIKRGMIKAARLGRHYRIKEENLNAFLENRSKKK